MTTDAVLEVNESTGQYDIIFNEDGDIETQDFFDTAILYSLFGERRASPDEVVEPKRRRGWIGNEDFENGSKLWLLEQARITRETLNRAQYEASTGLEWLVEDGFAVSIDDPVATVKGGKMQLEIAIRRSRDEVIRKFYTLWENTGAA
jgi:phage gp46-like protein